MINYQVKIGSPTIRNRQFVTTTSRNMTTCKFRLVFQFKNYCLHYLFLSFIVWKSKQFLSNHINISYVTAEA